MFLENEYTVFTASPSSFKLKDFLLFFLEFELLSPSITNPYSFYYFENPNISFKV